MSKEIGPFTTAVKAVFFNPAVTTEIRKVSGSGSPAWVAVDPPPTFAEFAVVALQEGASPFYFISLPTGLDATASYLFALYASTATAFGEDPDLLGYSPTGDEGSDVAIQEDDFSISDE